MLLSSEHVHHKPAGVIVKTQTQTSKVVEKEIYMQSIESRKDIWIRKEKIRIMPSFDEYHNLKTISMFRSMTPKLLSIFRRKNEWSNIELLLFFVWSFFFTTHLPLWKDVRIQVHQKKRFCLRYVKDGSGSSFLELDPRSVVGCDFQEQVSTLAFRIRWL
jgi:hypothetical protein